MKSHCTSSMLKSKLIQLIFFERKEVRLLYIGATGFQLQTSPAIFVPILCLLCLYYACTMSLLCLLCLYYACTMPTIPVLCLQYLYYAYNTCTMPTMPVLCLFITTALMLHLANGNAVLKVKQCVTIATTGLKPYEPSIVN